MSLDADRPHVFTLCVIHHNLGCVRLQDLLTSLTTVKTKNNNSNLTLQVYQARETSLCNQH